MRRAVGLCLAVALLQGISQAASANQIELDAARAVLGLDETVEVEILLDFSDATVGGELEIVFDDAVLELLSASFDPGLGDDPDFRCNLGTGLCPPGAGGDFLAFGSFSGIAGRRGLASLFFRAVGPGQTRVAAAPRAFSDELGGEISGIGVVPTGLIEVVPEPAAALLLGLAGLAAATRVALGLQRGREGAGSGDG